MEIKEFELYAKDLTAYSVADVRDLEFMTDEELDNYQLELERDSGNLSDWEHCRAVLTFRKKVAEMERLKLNIHHTLQYTHDEVLHHNLNDEIAEYIHQLLTENSPIKDYFYLT